MVKRHDRGADGKYHIAGKTFDMNEGSRAQVWHGTAYKTPGTPGLKKSDLIMVRGRIKSKRKSALAKTQKHLKGHLQPKGSGVFGAATKKKRGSKKARGKGKGKNKSQRKK
jgi:hypothetical protein